MARFTRIQVALKMAEEGMIPVFYNSDAEVCKKVIEACYNGGIGLFEFTNRGDYAHVVFEQINKFAAAEFPDMILGTGSVFMFNWGRTLLYHPFLMKIWLMSLTGERSSGLPVADLPLRYQEQNLWVPKL